MTRHTSTLIDKRYPIDLINLDHPSPRFFTFPSDSFVRNDEQASNSGNSDGGTGHISGHGSPFTARSTANS
jgi:hypothetical protein